MVMVLKWLSPKNQYKAMVLYLVATIAILLFASLLTGCRLSAHEKEARITLFAAASLQDAVGDIVSLFEQEHGSEKLQVSFAGSKTLRVQLENGAPADIFLSANEQHYKALLNQGILLKGKELLTNEMVLIVSTKGHHTIKNLQDLQQPHRLILADKEVPAGDYARQVIGQLTQAYGKSYEGAVLNNLVSAESNVRQVVTKIVLGEGDAAIVYKTDVTKDIQDQVRVIPIPADYNVKATYWIGLVNNDMISESVHTCYGFFSEEESEDIFKQYGFRIAE